VSGVEHEARARATAELASHARFLGPDQVDDLARALLTLAREVWVLRDRQRVLEAVLGERGIDVARAVEHHQPSAELQAQLDAERKAFVQGLMQALVPGTKG
jgi:hypothetical protein